MNEWQQILSLVRSRNQDLCTGQFMDMRPAWRAQAYRESLNQPEPTIRAEAFRRVLMEDSLYFYDGDRLCGSHFGWFRTALPNTLSNAEFEELVAEHTERGQRDFRAGFDHSLADYPTLLEIGVSGYLDRVESSLKSNETPREQSALIGMRTALTAFSDYMQRWSDSALSSGNRELADVARAVALNAPNTFHEALQLVAFTHLAFESEGRYAMALGRIDQYLLPFYVADLHKGLITRDDTLDLLCHMWVKLAENGGIQNICIGGLTPEGRDGTNELSLLCLEATKLVKSPCTNLSARFHDGTPDNFYSACFEVIRTGVGFPAIFNDHVLIPGLVEIGIPVEVARDHCMVGCIETMLPGRQQAWSDGRYNMPLQLMIAMQKVRTNPDLTYSTLYSAFLQEMSTSLTEYCHIFNEYIGRFPVDKYPDPFLSALTRDCIGRGCDINIGGAEYKRFHGIAIMGLATTVDSLAAVRKLVFDEGRISFDELMEALDADFAGYEQVRQALINRAPKYGNDIDEVDDLAVHLVEWTSRECLQHEITGGGRFVSAMAANTSNIPAGKEVGATPDGRLAYTPLSDAASPYFGRDTNGPTAFLNSVAKPDYHRVLTGSVINMKFEPEFYQGAEGERIFISLMKSFVKGRIQELQFNFTGNETLMEAKINPAMHGDLVVRVSGFSAYFVGLPDEVQDDVIRRHAHASS